MEQEGYVRGNWDTENGAAVFRMCDELGRTQVMIVAFTNGEAVVRLSRPFLPGETEPGGGVAISYGVGFHGPLIDLTHPDGRVAVRILAREEFGGFTINDWDERPRIMCGVMQNQPDIGITRPQPALLISDANANPVFAAP